MKLFRFDIPTAYPLPNLQSTNVLLKPLLDSAGALKVSCLYFGAGSQFIDQTTQSDRLFLVVSGRGWVRDAVTEYTRLQAGHAVFYEADEQFNIMTHNGMTMIVLEGDELHPEASLHPYNP